MKNMYGALAPFYDALNADLDYAKWANFIEENFRRYFPGKVDAVLDLACGTGRMAEELASRGYDMIGVDGSAEMLSEAYAAMGEQSILYLLQDMRSFELYGTVQGVVSALDGIGYLTERDDVIKCFKLIRNYLEPGALFLFDVNSEYRFREVLSKRDFFLEEDGVCLGWHSELDEETGMCDLFLTLFIKEEDGRYVRRDETQTEKLWTDEELAEMLCESGLEKVAVFSGFDMKAPTGTDEKRFYVARCPFDK